MEHSAGGNAWLFFWMAAATLLTTSYAHKYANEPALMAASLVAARQKDRFRHDSASPL
jgi:hypothetical protein